MTPSFSVTEWLSESCGIWVYILKLYKNTKPFNRHQKENSTNLTSLFDFSMLYSITIQVQQQLKCIYCILILHSLLFILILCNLLCIFLSLFLKFDHLV